MPLRYKPLRWKVELPIPGRSRKEGGMATRRQEEEERRRKRRRKRGGYMRVSPCIILRPLEKPKATTGCVAFSCFAYRHLKAPQCFTRAHR